jgi:general secretion pathway protein G
MIEALTKKRKEEGFTLIELLIVIVILGILAAIVVFAVGSTGKNAAASACSADAKSLEVALESYNAQNNGYPATPPTAASDTTNWAALTQNGGSNGPYLRAIPYNGTHYAVWFNASGSVFVATGGTTGSAYITNPTTGLNFDVTPGLCSNTNIVK